MNIGSLFETVRKRSPLVFCITNFVTVNDCANVILAAGASPVMSSDPREASDFAKCSGAVLLNMGTPTAESVEAMLLAGKTANESGIPVILDPVGAGATPLRQRIARDLLNNIHFAAIRGNAAEITFLSGRNFSGRGVDASTENELAEVESAVRNLAQMHHTTVCASGPVDVISDGERMIRCHNGHPIMTQITGSGCMSGALAAACIGAAPNKLLDALTASVFAMGISGEIAQKRLMPGQGTATFRSYLIDAVSLLTEQQMERMMRYEEK